LTPDEDCARIHESLQALFAFLENELRAPDRRAARARLIDRATVAAANARLRRHADLRADLQALLDDANALSSGGPDDRSVARLQRLIGVALSGTAEPDV
jgi:hypothetical protein